MEGSKNETSHETCKQPYKRPRLWTKGPPSVPDDEAWYLRMSAFKEKQLVQAIYDNAMNCVIEGTRNGRRDEIEDEAVAMAIRHHGLSYAIEPLNRNPEDRNWSREDECTASTSAIPPPNAFTQAIIVPPYGYKETVVVTAGFSPDDVLSHAVTAAIQKKGLGTADR